MNPKLIALARKLLVQTKAGAVHWSATDRDRRFLSTLSAATVVIEQQGPDVISLQLENVAGTVIEELSIVEVAFGMTNTDRDASELLKALHEAARRQVYQIDETLDSLLNELD